MKRLFQSLLGILFLPTSFVQSAVFYQSLRVLKHFEGDEVYFLYGVILYFLIHTLLFKPAFLYTLSHETVHAIVSMAFGGKVRAVRVSGKGGETRTTRSNILVEIAPYFGYSTTIGAFIGGITLANTIYKNEVLGRLRPLIVFFNMLFFVGLGFQMDLNLGRDHLLFIGILLALTLILKPLVIHWTLRHRGYDLKTAFISGLHLAQLSEFGIIIVAGGVLAGTIGAEIGSLAILLVIITMVISSYFIKYDDQIFKFCEPYLRLVDRKVFPLKQVKMPTLDPGCNMLFFGYYDLGPDLYNHLKEMGKKIMVIDNDPENIGMLKRENIPYIFNSVNNPDFFEKVSLQNIELAVSSLANAEDNKLIIRLVKKANPNAVVIVTAKNLRDSLELYNYRADYVLYPSYINHRQVSVLLEDYTTDINKVLSKKIEDVAKLKQIEQKRREVNKDLNKLWDMDSFFTNIVEKKKKIKTELKPRKLMKRSYQELGKLWDLDSFFKRMTEREKEKKEEYDQRLELEK